MLKLANVGQHKIFPNKFPYFWLNQHSKFKRFTLKKIDHEKNFPFIISRTCQRIRLRPKQNGLLRQPFVNPKVRYAGIRQKICYVAPPSIEIPFPKRHRQSDYLPNARWQNSQCLFLQSKTSYPQLPAGGTRMVGTERLDKKSIGTIVY